MNNPEILAPAGNEQCAYAAINAGCDALYLGLESFSARSAAENFSADSLEKLCLYAHALGVKVYAALNTVVKQNEVQSFADCAVTACNAGADALILQDIFLGGELKKVYPDLTLHLSTQAGVCNAYGAVMARDYGFSRVIAARETTLEDLAAISSVIECEAFVQGALCSCFSGQCYFSSFAGGNSGNRGRCKQPCRKKYEWNREAFGSAAYRLSLSDLCVGEDIKKYIDAGVASFKIEGRMRRPEYVAAAVKYYRKLIGGTASPQDMTNLKRAYNRGNYTRGLAFGQDKRFISSSVQGHIGEFAGNVFVENGKYVCKSSLDCSAGDGFKIFRGGEEIGGAVYAGKARSGFILGTKRRLKNGDKAFLTTDARLPQKFAAEKRKRRCNVRVELSPGKPACVRINEFAYAGNFILSEADTVPITDEEVIRCFGKTDNYPFDPDVDVRIDGRVFVPKSALNEIRRGAYKAYFESLSGKRRIYLSEPLNFRSPCGSNKRTAVICRDLSTLDCDIGILKPDDYANIDARLYKTFGGEKFLYVPAYACAADIALIGRAAPQFDGLYCDGLWGAQLCRELNKPLFAGTGFNIVNSAALSCADAKYLALSKELTASEARGLSCDNTFYLAAGDIKLMDLIYCPFEKTCKNCDRRDVYVLTDEEKRDFPVRRYTLTGCRFELYNCAELVSLCNFTGTLADGTLCDAGRLAGRLADEDKLKSMFKKYTHGHTVNGIL